MTSFDYQSLDPGIRCVVRLLHRWGYETIGSGDGRVRRGNKNSPPGMERRAYVVINAHAGWGLSVSQSDSLAYRVEFRDDGPGAPVTPQGQPGATIQYVYCPVSHDSTITLMDLSDADLPDALRAELEEEIEAKPITTKRVRVNIDGADVWDSLEDDARQALAAELAGAAGGDVNRCGYCGESTSEDEYCLDCQPMVDEAYREMEREAEAPSLRADYKAWLDEDRGP